MTELLSRERVYDGWLAVDRLRVRLPNGAVEERHLEDHGSAAAVLPYDPERRTALLVSQPRMPVVLAGEPPLLEAPAGRLEAGGAEATARAEALEEAGVRLGALEPVAALWSLPTFSTERLHLFLAPYAAADRIGPGGGSAHENECITVHEVALAELWRLAETRRLTDGKTLILAQALRIRRPGLFG